MLLPIAARELLVASRRPVTWRIRMGLTVAGLLVCWSLIGASGFIEVSNGRGTFRALTLILFAYALLAGLFFTADAVSEERREGTLGLLYLTRLSPLDLVTGKLASSSLQAFFALVAVLPVLFLPLLAGGVGGGELLRVAGVLVLTLLFSLAAGLLASMRRTESGAAVKLAAVIILFCTAGGLAGAVLVVGKLIARFVERGRKSRGNYALLALGCVLPLLAGGWVQWRSPMMLIGSAWPALSAALQNAAVEYAAHMAGLGAILISFIASAVLGAEWHSQPRETAAVEREDASEAPFGVELASAVRPGDKPVEWLLRSVQASRLLMLVSASLMLLSWLANGAMVGGILYDFAGVIPLLFFYFAAARQCAVPFFALRGSGLLEVVLTTPVRLEQLAMVQQQIFGRPIKVVICAVMGVSTFQIISSVQGPGELSPQFVIYFLVAWLVFYFQLRTLAWLGIAHAYEGLKPAAAAGRAVLLASVPAILFTQSVALNSGSATQIFLVAGAVPQLITLAYFIYLVRYAKAKLGLRLTWSRP